LLLETALPQLRLLRTHEHLDAAPQLVAHVVAQVNPSIGPHDSDGSMHTKASHGTLPFAVTPVDDADDLYGRLSYWTLYFARQFGELPPAHLLAVYTRNGDVAGLPAHALRFPEHATLLTATTAYWLQDHEHRIAATPVLDDYDDDINQMVASLHGRYPTAPPPAHRYFARPCDVCDEPQVRVYWTDAEDGPQILMLRCRNCRYTVPVTDLDRYLASAW
jgi:hypothetical protein